MAPAVRYFSLRRAARCASRPWILILSRSAASIFPDTKREADGKKRSICMDGAKDLDAVAAHIANGAPWNMGEICLATCGTSRHQRSAGGKAAEPDARLCMSAAQPEAFAYLQGLRPSTRAALSGGMDGLAAGADDGRGCPQNRPLLHCSPPPGAVLVTNLRRPLLSPAQRHPCRAISPASAFPPHRFAPRTCRRP